MSKYILSLDAGTTSCRAILADMDGSLVGKRQQEITQILPKEGWVEHDPEEIYEVQLRMIESILEQHGASPDDILSIGITNQRETTVVWHRDTGKPIYNAIVWQDKRTSDFAQSLRDGPMGADIISRTGLIPDAYFSATKIKWILDGDPKSRRLAEEGKLLFGTVDSWLIWKLTNGKSHVTDYTNASRTMIFNIQSMQWDEELLQLMDIPMSILPAVQPSISHFGDWHFGDRVIPINGVAGDQQAALFGQACFTPGMAKNTYGTGCFMLMNIGSEHIKSTQGLLTTLCATADDEPCYALEGSVFVAGAAIQWLRDALGLIDDSRDTEDIARSVEQDDLVVVPAFAGLGAPYWDMSARGAIFGLSRSADAQQIVKATLDSLAYQTADVLAAMEADADIHLDRLQVDGGACSNNYLMQFQSDILSVPVDRPVEIETTALGVAYMAGIYHNVWSMDDITKKRQIEKTFIPQLDDNKRTSLLSRWKDAVSRTRGWIKANSNG